MIRWLPVAFAILSGQLSVGTVRAEASPRPPNIVVIVSDDQGYADLGCLGRNEIQTPHLDRLAAEGVRCTNFYVSWPACTPSRGSILTGRYPQRNGLYDMIRNDVADYGKTFTPEEYAVTPERILGLDVREILISQVLKEADYATAVFGKWDGGQLRRYLPRQRGFDEFFGHTNTGIDYWTHERYGVPSMYRDNEPIKLEGYATELIKEEAVHFISEHKSEPFFLYVPFNAPHGASNFDKPGPQAPEEFTRRLYPNRDPRDSNRKRRRRTNYLACVTYMDACIGEMLDTLATHGLTDNTLVIFFSDNGGSSNADNRPLKGRKGQMFEGGLRVPFIARLPQRIPTGTLNHEFLTSLELFPTFTNLAGDKLPSGVVYDGFDMLPVLAGKKMSSRNEMFWKRRGDKAARVGNYKWVESAKGNGLFDLSNDPGEKRDLSAEHPDQLARLKNRFAKWEQDMNDAEPRGPFRDY